MFETKIDCQLVYIRFDVCTCPCHYLSREHGGCLSSSPLLKTFFLCDCLWQVDVNDGRWSFLSFDKIWPVPINWIKGWTGLNRCCCGRNGCRTFRNAMWHWVPICPEQFQLQSGYIVLPPRRRWDLCQAKLHKFGREDRSFRVVGEAEWRCSAPEFLLGLWDGCRLWEINSRVWSI